MYRLCFGNPVELYDGSTPEHLRGGIINVSSDVIDAIRVLIADEVEASVQKYVIPLMKALYMKL